MPNINKETKEVYENTTEKVEVKPTAEAPKEEKKARKPREKTREIEEIKDLPFSKLSDKEKEKLVKHLKEQNMLMLNKCEAFKKNAESAFAQTREMESKYDAMEKFYIRQLQYVDNQVNAFHAAINQAIKGGIQ